MTDPGLPWWITLAGSALPSLAIGLYQLKVYFDSRADRAAARQDSTQASRDAAMMREREMVSDGVASVVGNLRTDLAGCRDRLGEVQEEANRAWDIAHRWHALAWSCLGYAREGRQVAESTARLGGQPPPVWPRPLPRLPEFEDVHAGPEGK